MFNLITVIKVFLYRVDELFSTGSCLMHIDPQRLEVSSFALIALLNLSSWCLVMVERLFLAVPRGCLQFVIVVFPDHTHLLFLTPRCYYMCLLS